MSAAMSMPMSRRMFSDKSFDNTFATVKMTVPHLHFSLSPSPALAPAGSLAWDDDMMRMMFCTGQQWIAFNDAAVIASFNAFSTLVAAPDLVAPDAVPTT